MSEEEAIETIKHWVEYEKQNKEKINKADELIEVQEIVLNMLEKLKEDFDTIDHECDRLEEIDIKKDIKIENLNKEIKNKKQKIKNLDKEAQKYFEMTVHQNKIIDLMAEQLVGLAIVDKDIENPTIFFTKEEVIKYFIDRGDEGNERN